MSGQDLWMQTMDLIRELERKLADSEVARERAETLIERLESWDDASGQTYDVTNPEAQVQPIINFKLKAEADLARERGRLEFLLRTIIGTSREGAYHTGFVLHELLRLKWAKNKKLEQCFAAIDAAREKEKE